MATDGWMNGLTYLPPHLYLSLFLDSKATFLCSVHPVVKWQHSAEREREGWGDDADDDDDDDDDGDGEERDGEKKGFRHDEDDVFLVLKVRTLQIC